MLTWLLGSQERPPIFLKFRSSQTFIIVTVASSIFTDIFAYSLVVPVFPFALAERAAVDANDVQQWISVLLAIYGATLLVTSPLFGWLSDRMNGRQIPFLIGLVLLGGATVMLCVGNSLAHFAIGRALQGASATVVWVVGLALLVDTVGPEDIGAAMGYVGLAMSAALLLGPLLGGIVFESAGYYAVYVMSFGLIGMDIVFRILMIERTKAERWLSSEGTSPCMSSLNAGDKTENDVIGIQRTLTDASEKKATASGPQTTEQPGALTRSTSNAAEALPPPAPAFLKTFVSKIPPVVLLLGSRRIISALWATTIVSTLFTSFDSILPLYVKGTFGWNSTGAGLIFLPICVATFIGPLIGYLSDKFGPRWFATGGFVLACPVLIFLRLVDHNDMGQKVLLCALLALIGLALDLALTPIMAEIAYAVDVKTQRRPAGFYGRNGAYAQAYSLFNMAWAAGSMIGPLLGGFVNESKGWGATTLILGCVSIFTAVPTVIWTGGSIFRKRNKEREEKRRPDLEA